MIFERRSKVVVLCMDDQGIPKTVEGKLAIATKLFQKLREADIPSDHIYFDPLVLSISVEPEATMLTLEAIRELRSNFSNSHTICGVSNVSMGPPNRRLINRTFLIMAIHAGLDTLLINVRDQALLSSIYASKMLINQDSYCLEYLQAYRHKKILI